jgi:hypothetical protein
MRCGDGAEAYAMRWGGRVEVMRRVGDGVEGTRGAEVVWRAREAQRWCEGHERRGGAVEGTRGEEVVWKVREARRWCGGHERRGGGVEGTRGEEVLWRVREARRWCGGYERRGGAVEGTSGEEAASTFATSPSNTPPMTGVSSSASCLPPHLAIAL